MKWDAYDKLQKALAIFLHPADIFSYLSSPILKISCHFCRDSIFQQKVSKGF